MKRTFSKANILGGVSLIFALLMVLAVTTVSTERRRNTTVYIDPAKSDLGLIPENGSKSAELVFINNSSQTIESLKIKTSCSCITAETNTTELKAKTSTKVQVTLINHGHQGPYSATVIANWLVPATGEVGVSGAVVSGTGIYLANISPASLDFGSIGVDKISPSQTLEIRRGNSPFKWASVSALSKTGLIKATQISISDNLRSINVSLDTSSIPIGDFVDILTLRFSGVRKTDPFEDRSILVTARVVGSIFSVPQTLYFGTVSKGVILRGIINVESKFKDSIRLTSSKSTLDEHIFKFDAPIIRARDIHLPFTFVPNGPPGNLNGHVLISIKDSEKVNTLSIPIICYVTDGNH